MHSQNRTFFKTTFYLVCETRARHVNIQNITLSSPYFCFLSCWYDWISFVCTQNNSLQNVYFLLWISSHKTEILYITLIIHTAGTLKNGVACEYENKWYIPFNLTMKNLWCFPMWNECFFLRTAELTTSRISVRRQ